MVINPTLYERVPFDPYKDFDPVTLAVTSPDMLSVNPSLPVQSVKDLVALIKARPGKYNFASPGTGTPGHLVGELFRLSLGLDLVHIPFNSAGLAIGSTVADHTPIAFTTPRRSCRRSRKASCARWRWRARRARSVDHRTLL
jgi:tripartite-type tricarboxylate transporter receptor subunit TctC